MTPILMLLLSTPAEAGFGNGGASSSFSGLNPTMHAVVMDGQPLPFIPQLNAFVGVGLAGGAHTFQIMTLTGQVVMQTNYTVTDNTHEDCQLIPQPSGFVPNCARAAHPPYTAQSLAQLNVQAGPGGVSVTAPGLNVNINTGYPNQAAPPPQPQPQQPAAPQPVSEGKLQQLIAAVTDASFSDDQVSVLRTAASRNHFTCAQVARLVEPISFSDPKIEAVQALRPTIVDPENAHQLEAAFSFSSDKEQVRAMFR